MGGLCGYAYQCSISFCVVKNTLVSAVTKGGGLIGWMNGGTLTNSYQLGFSSDSSAMVVFSSTSGGGLTGECDQCCLLECGVERGKVYVTNCTAGGITGSLTPRSFFCQVYSTSSVTVQSGSNVGGLCGVILAYSDLANFTNCYSDAILSSANNTNVGGLIGFIQKTIVYFKEGSKGIVFFRYFEIFYSSKKSLHIHFFSHFWSSDRAMPERNQRHNRKCFLFQFLFIFCWS